MKGANNIWKSLFQSSVAIYRNHPIELLHKSVDHFLYNGNRDDKQNASDASDASASVVSAKKYFLKIVSALFGQFDLLSLKDSTCETRKIFFYFISKALFVLEKSKIQNFRYSSFLTSSNAYAKSKQYLLLNNLGSKHSLLIKFGQFMSYYKRKYFIKKLQKNYDQEIRVRSFCVYKELSTISNLK